MRPQIEKTQRPTPVVLEERRQVYHDSGRLGHLLPTQIDHAVVQPVPTEDRPRGSLALGDLILVMREYEIGATAVDVEILAEVFRGHCGALDMPAGPPVPPR